MKRALIIGINSYLNNRLDQLEGCICDAENIITAFNNPVFSFDLKRPLTNSNATKEVIIRNLSNDIESCQKDDSFVFFFSGHGAQVKTLEGGKESDGLDEVLCPSDFNEEEGIYLRDRELAEIFGEGLKRGVNIEMILDSCFSGGIKMDSFGMKILRILKKITLPYSKSRCIQSGVSNLGKDIKKFEMTVQNSLSASNSNFVLWAACKENQEAKEKEIDGKIQGVFTHFFCSCLKNDASRSEIYGAILNQICSPSQTPQLKTHKRDLTNLPIFQFG